jgi:hypothetical protein
MTVLDDVRADLEHIRDTWDNDITEARLKADSAVLRRLLIDGTLQAAYAADGQKGEPKVWAPDLAAMIPPNWLSKVALASAGGAEHREMMIAAVLIAEGTQPVPTPPDPPMRQFALSDFTGAIVIRSDGVMVSRRDVIRFAGGKLSTMLYGDAAAARALTATRNFDIQGFPAYAWEVLAAGQLLLRSADVSSLVPWGALPPWPGT